MISEVDIPGERDNDLRDLRASLEHAKRIVVKVGTNVLVKKGGQIHDLRVASLVRQLAKLAGGKKEVVLVTSGAIGAGVQALGLKRRPRDVPGQQVAASVGQGLLMSKYSSYFSRHGLLVGQLLLTHDDLRNRKRHLNMRNTVLGLLKKGIVPIVNENDVVSVDELKFGDNDVLAALLSTLVEADLLIILSTTNGLKRPVLGEVQEGTSRRRSAEPKMERVKYLDCITREVKSWAFGKGGELSTGGMETKLKAVEIVLKGGGVVAIADGRDPKNIQRLISGCDVGTVFGQLSDGNHANVRGALRRESSGTGADVSEELQVSTHNDVRHIDVPAKILPSRKRWIAFFHKPKGRITVDDGAAVAIMERGVSLLPVGVRCAEGNFSCGDVVDICDAAGLIIARGTVNYSAKELVGIAGKRSKEIASIVGAVYYEEVVHRDNMVLIVEG